MEVVREIIEKKRSFVMVLDSGEQFWITRSQLREYGGIEVGQELDADALREWLLPRQYPMALNNAVELLAQRAHASGEIAQKLRRRLYMEDTIEMVLYKLEKERLLDDEAFAREWAASRARSQVGRTRIRQELRMKGISQETVQLALDELDEEESDDAAVALAKKLVRRYSREEDERKGMQKLLAAMARRGYGYEESKQAVEAALEEMDE